MGVLSLCLALSGQLASGLFCSRRFRVCVFFREMGCKLAKKWPKAPRAESGRGASGEAKTNKCPLWRRSARRGRFKSGLCDVYQSGAGQLRAQARPPPGSCTSRLEGAPKRQQWGSAAPLLQQRRATALVQTGCASTSLWAPQQQQQQQHQHGAGKATPASPKRPASTTKTQCRQQMATLRATD